ncbi:hypothetical protein, partial [Paenibacillus alginolyticus]|uniref:hypothetical protein n=1 Tax=Paenibacillus alginolyticus TaxID=59839 RepID=UPI001C3F6E3D
PEGRRSRLSLASLLSFRGNTHFWQALDASCLKIPREYRIIAETECWTIGSNEVEFEVSLLKS